MKKKDTLTIPEVARQLQKTINTVYRYIKSGKLKSESIVISGKKVIRIKEQDLVKFCNAFNISRYNNDISDDMFNDISEYNTDKHSDISEEIKQAVNNSLSLYHKDFLEKVFNAGVLTKENQFLKERLETVLQENELLREQVKALPDLQTIQEKEKDLIIQIEMERKEKEDLKSTGETIRQEQEEKHRKELEELETREKELHRQELEQIKQEHERTLKLMSESAEKEKMEIVEAWKKKTEELERPWWKFW